LIMLDLMLPFVSLAACLPLAWLDILVPWGHCFSSCFSMQTVLSLQKLSWYYG
jgi:hypothetical protein